MADKVKVKGVWKDIAGMYVKTGSGWKPVVKGFTQKANPPGLNTWNVVYGEYEPPIPVPAETFWIQEYLNDQGYISDFNYIAGSGIPFWGTTYGDVNICFNGFLNSDGDIVWQKKILVGGDSSRVASGCSDNSNMYELLYSYPNNKLVFAKQAINDGSLQEVVTYSPDTSTWPAFNRSMSVRNSNIYATVSLNSGGFSPIISGHVFKFDSDLVLDWQKKITNPGGDFLLPSSWVDNSGYVYGVGGPNPPSTGDVVVFKLNTDGSIIWSQKIPDLIGDSTYEFVLTTLTGAVKTDNSGNVYVTGWYGDSEYVAILKYSSSGTLLDRWLFSADNTFYFGYGHSLHISENDSIYLSAYTSEYPVIIALDVNGNILWQNKMFNDGGTIELCGGDSETLILNVDWYDAVEDYQRVFNFKVPADGSLTGTYEVNGNIVEYLPSTVVNVTKDTPSGISFVLTVEDGDLVEDSETVTLDFLDYTVSTTSI